jgi:hypothetical protein
VYEFERERVNYNWGFVFCFRGEEEQGRMC